MSAEIVTVNLSCEGLSPDETRTVAVSLYIADESLACAGAALAASATAQMTSSTATLRLQPDMSVQQAGKSWSEMVEPSMYVSLDCEASSTLTYASGPVFGVQPGQTVELDLKPR